MTDREAEFTRWMDEQFESEQVVIRDWRPPYLGPSKGDGHGPRKDILPRLVNLWADIRDLRRKIDD